MVPVGAGSPAKKPQLISACRIDVFKRHISGRPETLFSVSYSFSVSTKSAQRIEFST